MLLLLTGVLLLLLATTALAVPTPKKQLSHEDRFFWEKASKDEVEASIRRVAVPIERKAKNVILFLGDGMGVTTITAARIFKGQLKGAMGEEGYLTFDRFPHVGLLKTYNVDRQVPDSAATATAYLTGVKANYGTIGVDVNVKKGNCSSYEEYHRTFSFLVQAVEQGKSVGLVTTTRITHATPAGSYAHIPHREWESDTDMILRNLSQAHRSKCADLAQQLIQHAFPFKVIFGGGRAKFFPNSTSDPVMSQRKGERSDGRNLVEEWMEKHRSAGHRAEVVYRHSDLSAVQLERVEYLLGLFSHNHLEYEEDRKTKNLDEPSLADMTTAAIKVLQGNPKGFVMLVEGGRIDHAHHHNMARNALSETVAMDEAVEAAVGLTSEQDTLIMVTADHSHVFTMGSYPSRGNNILGKTDYADLEGSAHLALDDKPVTTLLYMNGISGLKGNTSRADLSKEDTTRLHHKFQSLVPLSKETHGGEDVAVFARGPWSHLFHRTHEQTQVAQVARFAACLPPYEGSNCRAGRGTAVTLLVSWCSWSGTGAALTVHVSVLLHRYLW